jgi:hypothetical protein
MLDAKKYAQHFPDESRRSDLAADLPATAPSVDHSVVPSPSLLAALSQLEREFREILRAQQAEPTGHPE